MALVRKKNRVLTINDNAIDVYLSRGYDQIDESGKVIKGAKSGKIISLNEFNKLQDAFQDLSNKHDDLKLKHEELKKENSTLKGQITKLKKATEDDKSEKEKK